MDQFPSVGPGEVLRDLLGVVETQVGREKEVAQLTDALAEVRGGRGQIATLMGEAGVGKSRLIAELKEVALAPPAGHPIPL